MLQAAANTRVILHLDFDCYYCQVEQKRLGIPRDTPCAVQQWEGLIAVNYAARAKGVSRHMRVAEAKQKCPDIRLVHVETIGTGEARTGGDGQAETDPAQAQHNRLTQKASLERYRRSTAEVLGLLHRLAPKAVIEKASIDEVYMDVTAMVDQELQGHTQGTGPPSTLNAFGWGSIVVGGPLDVGSEFDRRLAKGAEIACRLRGALLSDMGYTSSAGIACNKLLAKVGSAMHKPNQQTVIPPRGVQEVMRELPLKKLRNFGGKLGAELEELGCGTAGEVQQLPQATLVARFGAERAAAIAQAVRGESLEPVQERERPKSMLAAKSFNPTSDLDVLGRWFAVLAEELAGRMATDEVQYRRRPRNLVVHYRAGNHPGGAGAERSKSCAMPRFGPEGPSADTLAHAALALFTSRCLQEALPCNRLAISAAEFQDLPSPSSHSAITRFLVPRPATAPQPPKGGSGPPPPLATAETRDSPVHTQQAQQPQHASHHAQHRSQGMSQQHAPPPAITALFNRARKRRRADGAAVEVKQQARHSQQQRGEEGQGPAGRHTPPPPPLQQQPAHAPLHGQSAQQAQHAQQHAGMHGEPLGSTACSSSPLGASPPAAAAAAATALREGGCGPHGPPRQPAADLPPPPCEAGAEGEGAGARPPVATGPAAVPSAVGTGECCPPSPPAGSWGKHPLLEGVDLQEQARILKEIELRKALGGGAPAGTRPCAGDGLGAGGRKGLPSGPPPRQQQGGLKQKGISGFLRKC